jgi:hypothetical protein
VINYILKKTAFLLVIIFIGSEAQADTGEVGTPQSYELKGEYNKVEPNPGWRPIPKYSDRDCDDFHISNSIYTQDFTFSWGSHQKTLNPPQESVIFEACITSTTALVLNEINNAFLLVVNRSTKDNIRLYLPKDRIHLEPGKSIRVKWRTLKYFKNYSSIHEVSNDKLYAKSLHVMQLTINGQNFNSGDSLHKDYLGRRMDINLQFFPMN